MRFPRVLPSFRFTAAGGGFVIVMAVSIAAFSPGHAATLRDYETNPLWRNPDILNPSSNSPLAPGPQAIPKLIFFPPNPPALGAVIDFTAAKESVSRAPEALAPFVGEPFYAPLSTFISPIVTGYQGGGGLMEGDVTRLRSFQRLRDELLSELRKTIDRYERAPAAERESKLQSLARAQARALAELEDLADDLRERLAKRADWSELREWRLRQDELPAQPGVFFSYQIQVVRAAAFYQDGLAPAQRRLLLELVVEMEEKAYIEPGTPSTARVFEFFLPETARVRFPRALPGLLAARLQRFLQEKDALKRELGDAIVSTDDQINASRSAALRKLAKSQAPRISALEDLAEEIRRELPAVAGFTRWPRPKAIPDELLQRLVRTQRRYKEMWQASTEPDRAAQRAMENELNELHRSLELAMQMPIDRPNIADADAFITKFLNGQRQNGAYYDYDMAAFEPGLSPAQRRLLFRAALADLGLPLPGADRQATSIQVR